jgi:hypothetical protein
MQGNPRSKTSNGKLGGVRVALECRIRRDLAILVPLESVAQAVELEVWAPPPQAHPSIGGFAYHERSLLVTVLASPRDLTLASPSARSARGVWLVTPGQELGWILEVDEIASLVDARPAAGGHDGMSPWFRACTTSDDRKVPWLDVDAMLAALGG